MSVDGGVFVSPPLWQRASTPVKVERQVPL